MILRVYSARIFCTDCSIIEDSACCMCDGISYLPSRLYKYTERYEVIQPESSILLLIKALKNQEKMSTCPKIFWKGSAAHKN